MTDYNTPFPTAPPPQHAQHGELSELYCVCMQWFVFIPYIYTVNPPSYSESPQSYGSTNYAPGYQGGAGYQQQQPYNTAYPPSTYQPAPLVYNTTNTTTVVNTQPNLPTYRAPKPSSYIWLSVITMLCCCFVLGLIALIIGLEVRESALLTVTTTTPSPPCVCVCMCRWTMLTTVAMMLEPGRSPRKLWDSRYQPLHLVLSFTSHGLELLSIYMQLSSTSKETLTLLTEQNWSCVCTCVFVDFA